MKIEVKENTLTISDLEELTAANAGTFQKAVQTRMMPNTKKLHLVADTLKLMDSTGLGALIILHKRVAQSDGQTIISNPSGSVEQLLKMTRLNRVFQIAK